MNHIINITFLIFLKNKIVNLAMYDSSIGQNLQDNLNIIPRSRFFENFQTKCSLKIILSCF